MFKRAFSIDSLLWERFEQGDCSGHCESPAKSRWQLFWGPCPARRRGDGADVTCRWRDTAGPHNIQTATPQQLWGFVCGFGGVTLLYRIYFCTIPRFEALLQSCDSPDNNPRREADPLWRWKPQFEYSARCWPGLSLAGSRSDCGIGAAICPGCHLSACCGDEWIWIISSNITSSLFRAQAVRVPPCHHNNISRS